MKNNMKDFNIETIKAEMKKQLTVTDKLDYWLSIKERYIDNGENLEELFGKGLHRYSPIEIPKTIYDEHFKNSLDDPEFTHWMLKYEAETYFNLQLKYLEKNYSEPEILGDYILSELKQLNDFEAKATKLFIEKAFNIYSVELLKEYWREKELKRIQAKYYESHPDVHPETVILYAEHILYKKYLENKLKELKRKNIKPLDQKDLDQKELALFRVYEGLSFEYNVYEGLHSSYQKKSSIKKLMELFKYYENIKNRQRDTETATTIKNLINKIEKIRPLLTIGKDKAEKDLTVLYTHLKKHETK